MTGWACASPGRPWQAKSTIGAAPGTWGDEQMQRWFGLDEVPAELGRSVVTIGEFDGVHRGHQRIVERARVAAAQLGFCELDDVTADAEVAVPGRDAAQGFVDVKYPAVAAQQWKAVAEVFKYGLANLHPMSQAAIGWGAAVGVVLALAGALVPKRYKNLVPSPTGLGLGMVLPFFYPLAMFLGALFATTATLWKKDWAEKYLVAIAAGGIAGESIVGVVVQALNNFVLH